MHAVVLIITTILGAIGAILMGDNLRNLVELFQIKWWFRCFIAISAVIVVLVIAAIVVAFVYPYFIYEMMNPIDSSLQDSDWDTLVCYLNCVSTKKPENRPILIICELINFHPDTLNECLRAMEKAKEDVVYLPIILETSDNLWSETLAFKRSSMSFSPYYMQEMSYEEGEQDLIKSGLFTLDEYKLAYEKLGGHIGSYKEILDMLNYARRCTFKSALEKVQHKATVLVHACILFMSLMKTVEMCKLLA